MASAARAGESSVAGPPSGCLSGEASRKLDFPLRQAVQQGVQLTELLGSIADLRLLAIPVTLCPLNPNSQGQVLLVGGAEQAKLMLEDRERCCNGMAARRGASGPMPTASIAFADCC
jgi:hypothetical protein